MPSAFLGQPFNVCEMGIDVKQYACARRAHHPGRVAACAPRLSAPRRVLNLENGTTEGCYQGSARPPIRCDIVPEVG
jgi:hypothetical protein